MLIGILIMLYPYNGAVHGKLKLDFKKWQNMIPFVMAWIVLLSSSPPEQKVCWNPNLQDLWIWPVGNEVIADVIKLKISSFKAGPCPV